MPASKKVVDFTKVKDRTFNPKHLPEGQYPMRVAKVEDYKSKAGNEQWLFTLRIEKGTGKGASYPYYCGLDADSAWKVRNIFESAGINIPKKKVNADPNKLIGRTVWAELEDDEYEGKMKSSIGRMLLPTEVEAAADADEDDEEVEDEEEEEEEAASTTAKKAAKKAAKKVEEDEEEEPAAKKKKKKSKPAVDDDELEELDIEEL